MNPAELIQPLNKLEKYETDVEIIQWLHKVQATCLDAPSSRAIISELIELRENDDVDRYDEKAPYYDMLLAYVYALSEDIETAIEESTSSVSGFKKFGKEKDWQQAMSYWLYGLLLSQQGQYDNAKAKIDNAIKIIFGLADEQYRLGLYEKHKELRDVIENIENIEHNRNKVKELKAPASLKKNTTHPSSQREPRYTYNTIRNKKRSDISLQLNRSLRVFLCYSKDDKPAVRGLYQKLRTESWIQPWLDEEDLLPGQDWDSAIQKAVENTDVVIVCLSNNSVNKEGYVQRELRFALDIALEKPEDTIFVIPLRLEKCELPRKLRAWQCADYFPESQRGISFQKLLLSLKTRAESLDLNIINSATGNNLRKEIKHSRFYRRSIHLEYKINADAQVINNYLLQRYTSISTFVEFDKLTLHVDGIESFNPVEHDVFQYGFIARGHSSFAVHGYSTIGEARITEDPKFELVPEMFLITISQGQKDVSILSFDTDIKHAHMFTTGLVRELSKAFSVRLVS